MKFSITHRKPTASFRIVGLMLAIAPLWLMLAAVNTPAHAQTSDDVSNSSAATTNPSLADWTQFLRDNMQRWNPYETVLAVNNVGGLQVKWKNPIGSYLSAIESSPAVVNGVVYFGSDDGNVYALNASTGAKLWSYTTGSYVFSSPAVVNGVVYVGSVDGNMYALYANTGAKLWSYASGPVDYSSPAVANGVVYFSSFDNNFYALNASTGAKLWSYTNTHSSTSSPAVANGVVYVGSEDNNVYALNASTGARLWSYATGGPVIYSSPAVVNGVIYIGSADHNVYALNASTGAKLWSYSTVDIIESSPAVVNGVVYIGSGDGNVYALNASTGVKLWSYDTHGFVESSPAVANGVVYVGGGDGNVYALNAGTGVKLWSYVVTSGLTEISSPTIVDGVLYIRAGNQSFGTGNTYAFGLGSVDLFLRIRPSTTTVHQGDLLTYAFPVWNLGPSDAVHEVLKTQVPEGTTFDYIRISGTPRLGTCTHPPYQGTGQIVCHENSSMAPNTTWTVRLTVKVTAPAGTVITENAATIADTPDPNLANNTATVSIKVQ
jgi:outer membrane protein assembly factor BamB